MEQIYSFIIWQSSLIGFYLVALRTVSMKLLKKESSNIKLSSDTASLSFALEGLCTLVDLYIK